MTDSANSAGPAAVRFDLDPVEMAASIVLTRPENSRNETTLLLTVAVSGQIAERASR